LFWDYKMWDGRLAMKLEEYGGRNVESFA